MTVPADPMFSEIDESQSVHRIAWLMNPGELPQQHVRLTVRNGVVVEIAPLPPDERSSATPTVLMPRLVNAHTHLEFSALTTPLSPATPFVSWIRSVIAYRMADQAGQAERVSHAVASGVRESVHAGVAAVGEITTSDHAATSFRNHGQAERIGGVSFREVIGFTPDRIDSAVYTIQQHLDDGNSGNCVPGISPHAPYSVHPHLVEALVDIAVAADVPVAMHLAETLAELELLETQTGDFVAFLRSLNLWDESILKSGTTPLTYLQQLSKCPLALAIHGNYFGDREIRFLAAHPHVATVYCPRTHAYFGHTNHPWQRLQDAGATVVLGTDSRASNPDLSVWKELQTIAAASGRPIWELLPMATTRSAAALGLPSEPFRIATGQPLLAACADAQCDTISRLNGQLVASSTGIREFP